MLTKTALLNPAFLIRIKGAVERAIRKANKPGAKHATGWAEVFNAKGRYSLQIVARKGGKWEAFDCQDRDVTDLVLSGLRAYHAAKRQNVDKPARLAGAYRFGPAGLWATFTPAPGQTAGDLYAIAAERMGARP